MEYGWMDDTEKKIKDCWKKSEIVKTNQRKSQNQTKEAKND